MSWQILYCYENLKVSCQASHFMIKKEDFFFFAWHIYVMFCCFMVLRRILTPLWKHLRGSWLKMALVYILQSCGDGPHVHLDAASPVLHIANFLFSKQECQFPPTVAAVHNERFPFLLGKPFSKEKVSISRRRCHWTGPVPHKDNDTSEQFRVLY